MSSNLTGRTTPIFDDWVPQVLADPTIGVLPHSNKVWAFAPAEKWILNSTGHDAVNEV
jgi:hypothetical protein